MKVRWRFSHGALSSTANDYLLGNNPSFDQSFSCSLIFHSIDHPNIPVQVDDECLQWQGTKYSQKKDLESLNYFNHPKNICFTRVLKQ